MNECPRDCGCATCMATRNKTIQKFMKFRDIVASHDRTGNLITEDLFKKLVKSFAKGVRKRAQERQKVEKQQARQKQKEEKVQVQKKQKEQTLINKSHLYAYPEGYSKEEQRLRRAPRKQKTKLPVSAAAEIQKPFDFKTQGDKESLKPQSSSSKMSDEDWLNKVFGAK